MASFEKIYENLSDETKAKLKDCKSKEDLMKLAQIEGVKLTDEQLEAVSGGSMWQYPPEYGDNYH